MRHGTGPLDRKVSLSQLSVLDSRVCGLGSGVVCVCVYSGRLLHFAHILEHFAWNCPITILQQYITLIHIRQIVRTNLLFA